MSGAKYGDQSCINAILASPHNANPHIIQVINNNGMNEFLYGGDVGDGYSAYLLISYYRGLVGYKENKGTVSVTDI